VQGLALAELTAIWLAGHHVDVRADLMAMQYASIHDLALLLDAERTARLT
jgi:hypothetical protein